LDIIPDLLNIRNVQRDIPPEFKQIYDEQKYQKALDYLIVNTRFGILRSSLFFGITLTFFILGGFEFVDTIARHWIPDHPIRRGLVFVGILGGLRSVLGLPFSLYHTFVIEENFGFNKTTATTFVTDLIKGVVLSILLGGSIFTAIVYFFEYYGGSAWILAWLFFTGFQLLISFLAPVLILPLFNQYKVLENGELKEAVLNYAKMNHFKFGGIYTMDGSKRSSKTNAFFTGFGKFKKLVLFDTLLEKHSTPELVAVFAHEAGHYKLGHIPKMIFLSIASSFIMFYLMALWMNNPNMFEAFQMTEVSAYASLVIVGFLISPIMKLFSIWTQRLSRKHEFEADAYSLRTFQNPNAMIDALKKLSIDNLSYLTPHPFKVMLDYTHPPVLKRIEAIRKPAIS
jgi:STE24 endopeptidase